LLDVVIAVGNEELLLFVLQFIKGVFLFLDSLFIQGNIDLGVIENVFIYLIKTAFRSRGDVLANFGVVVLFVVFQPTEEGRGAFIVIESLVVLALVEVFVAFLSQFFEGHEAGVALDVPDLLVALAVVEEDVL
jgi:hypothetical protein